MAASRDKAVIERVAEELVRISPIALEGTLAVPAQAKGIVLFAHGSGSSRLSPRNIQVAGGLHRRGIATLLFDLLTEDESADRRNVFNIPLLAQRLMLAHDWLDQARPELAALPKGYFGASTGAGAALVAVAQKRPDVWAVVSRGGRPDLASEWLARVEAPTLLIIGGYDSEVIALNKSAFERLRCEKAIEIVPGATHLFEEPGTLEIVTEKAASWFATHFEADRPGAGI